jgi:hypothetical protein
MVDRHRVRHIAVMLVHRHHAHVMMHARHGAHGIFLQETEISGATTISRIANSAVNAAARFQLC